MHGAHTTSDQSWGYRPHLDGLRTVAVYLVVAYHAGLPTFVGGFVGVDLFFVLSGYLVTNVLLTELTATGSIRLSRFYARRVRRLLPAAAVLVVGVAAAAVLVSSPLERASFADDARAASLWFANWHFIIELGDYFAVDGPESPFIHFWSLAIEEQFYLAFPLLIVVIWRLRRSLVLLVSITGLVAVISLILQIAIAPGDVNRAYLGTDTRVYQILAGAVFAMAWSLRRSNASDPDPAGDRPNRAGPVLALAGLVGMVVVGSSALDVSASVRGILATATSLVIIVALEVVGGGVVAAALSLRPIRYLGQISYGTYLWHWPVMVLSATVLDMSPLATALVGGVVGSGLAALSAELVERPVRSARRLDGSPRPVIAVGVASAVVVGVAVAPALLQVDRRPVIAARGGGSVAAAISGPVPDLDWRAIETSNPDVPPCERDDGSDCFIATGSSGTVLLMGDSHARMLIPAMAEIAARRDVGVALAFAPSCPWQRDLLAGDDGDRFTERCRRHQPRAHDRLLTAIDPDVIVVAGFPRSTARGTGFTDRPDWQELTVEELVAAATTESVNALAGRAPLVIVEPVPILPTSQISCLSGASDLAACAFPPDPEGVEEAVERRLAADSDRVVTVDLDGPSCPAVVVCDPIIDGVVVRRDAHHFTPEFALTVVPMLEAALDDASG